MDKLSIGSFKKYERNLIFTCVPEKGRAKPEMAGVSMPALFSSLKVTLRDVLKAFKKWYKYEKCVVYPKIPEK